MDFSKVLAPISNQLEEFEKEFRTFLETDSTIIREISEHLYGAPGKRLRPALLFLTSDNHNESVKFAALAVELIHTATLLHDDVIDESRTRRGIDTVNSRWNNLVSVLMGDYFFARAFGLLVKADSPALMASFARATERVSVGELNQAFCTGNFDIAEETYLEIIADKTASLFACSAEAGAICSDRNGEVCEGLKNYGENIGLAFQITDDLLDLVGETKKTGKSLGSDIREGWVTLPLIKALQNDNGNSHKKFRDILGGDVRQSDFEEILNFVRDNGGIEYAEQRARQYVEKAVDIIDGLDGLPMKAALKDLANLAAVRDR